MPRRDSSYLTVLLLAITLTGTDGSRWPVQDLYAVPGIQVCISKATNESNPVPVRAVVFFIPKKAIISFETGVDYPHHGFGISDYELKKATKGGAPKADAANAVINFFHASANDDIIPEDKHAVKIIGKLELFLQPVNLNALNGKTGHVLLMFNGQSRLGLVVDTMKSYSTPAGERTKNLKLRGDWLQKESWDETTVIEDISGQLYKIVYDKNTFTEKASSASKAKLFREFASHWIFTPKHDVEHRTR